jgi:hypothetical protein
MCVLLPPILLLVRSSYTGHASRSRDTQPGEQNITTLRGLKLVKLGLSD